MKEPFYTVKLDCGKFLMASEKLKDRNVAERMKADCDGKEAVIRKVERQEKTVAPPKLYDLTTLQREAKRMFGYTAQQTLEYAQELYEKKLITYPRTDSRFLTESMTEGITPLVLSTAAVLPFIKPESLAFNTDLIADNTKISDHHAIIPTVTMSKADLSALPLGEKQLLFMIAVRLIAAVNEKQRYAVTSVTADCNGHEFTANGKTVTADGWKAIEQGFVDSIKAKPDTEQDDSDEQSQTLPELHDGDVVSVTKSTLHEGFTSPPKRMTEDTLLSAMETAGIEDMPEDAERKGLGTPATRASIIEKLVKTCFLERKKKQIVPTEKGMNLIRVLPDTVISPLLTADWESKLKQIERGELTEEAFMWGIDELVVNLIQSHKAPNEQYLKLFVIDKSQCEPIGTCPRCKSGVYENKNGFFCANKACGFGMWKNDKFFSNKKKELTREVATALLADGRVSFTDLYSDKT